MPSRMDRIIIQERQSFDIPPKPYFKIQEEVGGGLFYEWTETFSTRESAIKYVEEIVEEESHGLES